MKNILGLDLSISSTGFSVIQDGEIVKCGRIVTEGKDLSPKSKKHLDYEYFYSNQHEDWRIYYISRIIKELIAEYDIDTLCIEDQYLGKNPKTALTLSKAKGSVVYVGLDSKAEVHYLKPTEIRKLLNNKGGSDKELVSLHIRRNYIDVGEFSDKIGKLKTSDIYDAIAVCLAFCKQNNIEVKSTY